jgi:hypothetical protein
VRPSLHTTMWGEKKGREVDWLEELAGRGLGAGDGIRKWKRCGGGKKKGGGMGERVAAPAFAALTLGFRAGVLVEDFRGVSCARFACAGDLGSWV